jgi:hypothetical protein
MNGFTPALPQFREAAIEAAIMAQPELLGFPGALAIRRCRVAQPCGLVDLILLPPAGPTRLVLVEANASSAPDAAAKVIGQLLMYYAGALMLGEEGLAMLRSFARDNPERACSTSKISPKAVTGGLSPGDLAWDAMYRGTKLRPDEIALFVAFDGEPHRAFVPTLQALAGHHGLPIGYCVVHNGSISLGAV